MKIGYDQKHRSVYNTCPSCGTLNYFDESVYTVYSKARCYQCNNLMEVPDAYKLVKQQIFENLQKNTHPSLRELQAEKHAKIAKMEARKTTK